MSQSYSIVLHCPLSEEQRARNREEAIQKSMPIPLLGFGSSCGELLNKRETRRDEIRTLSKLAICPGTCCFFEWTAQCLRPQPFLSLWGVGQIQLPKRGENRMPRNVDVNVLGV